MEDGAEYTVYIDGADAGTVKANMGGKLVLSVELDCSRTAAIKIVKSC